MLLKLRIKRGCLLLLLLIDVVLKVLVIKNKIKKYRRGNMFVIEKNTVVCRWYGFFFRNCERLIEKLILMLVSGLIGLMVFVIKSRIFKYNRLNKIEILFFIIV